MMVDDDGWTLVGDGTPLGVWLETKRGESGVNRCFCRMATIGADPEWIEHSTGVTTVTHGTFLAPTHWRWPVGEKK